MHSALKIILGFIGIVLLISLTIQVLKFLGYPYLRVQLIGTSYIENTEELYALAQVKDTPYFLIKKYKYSKNQTLIGYGGGSSKTVDYYGLGIADKNKNEILPPKYEFLYTKQNFKTKEVYIHAVPFIKTGNELHEYYIIENNKLIAIERKY